MMWLRTFVHKPEFEGYVREFLESQKTLLRIEIDRSIFRLYRQANGEARAWLTFSVVSHGGFRSIRCYYRKTPEGYEISDCGDAVSQIMKQTGCDGADAERAMRGVLLNDFPPGHLIHNACIACEIRKQVTAEQLPAAIVAVLCAVAHILKTE